MGVDGAVVGSGGGSCFLGTLAGGRIGVFGLVGATLALGFGGGDLSGGGGSVAVGGIRIGLSYGGGGVLLATAFLGGFGAGSDFGVGVTSFGIGGFDFDGFATLLGSGFGRRSAFVAILGVPVDGSFALFLLGRGSGGCGVDGGAALELFL